MADGVIRVDPGGLGRFVAGLLQRHGLALPGAQIVAQALVEADLGEIPSHGVMLVPLYVERLAAGSVSKALSAAVVQDGGSTLVLDAAHAFGQLTSAQAVTLLRERARAHGLAAVSVRNAFHFGAAGHWAALLAADGLVGLALSNTRPLMPAPGGAERVVGNNPLALAVPSVGAPPLVVDFALSVSAMGRIRLAAASGAALPAGWAVDAQGSPTTDAARAVEGMLLPAGGPKGFGLAFMIDLLCGGLSGGAIGAEVGRLYGDVAQPYGCAHFFAAFDVTRFVPLEVFAARAQAFAQQVRASARAPGIGQLFSPGERSWLARQRNRAGCPVAPATLRQLDALGLTVGLRAPEPL